VTSASFVGPPQQVKSSWNTESRTTPSLSLSAGSPCCAAARRGHSRTLTLSPLLLLGGCSSAGCCGLCCGVQANDSQLSSTVTSQVYHVSGLRAAEFSALWQLVRDAGRGGGAADLAAQTVRALWVVDRWSKPRAGLLPWLQRRAPLGSCRMTSCSLNSKAPTLRESSDSGLLPPCGHPEPSIGSPCGVSLAVSWLAGSLPAGSRGSWEQGASLA